MKTTDMRFRLLTASMALSLATSGCVTPPLAHVQRATQLPPVVTGPAADVHALVDDADPVRTSGSRAQLRQGSGQMINTQAAARPTPSLAGASSGSATFNFEGESVHAVIKAILGDLLGQNYVIAPGVTGTVTLATPRPVSPGQALNLLEMVLGWNNSRLVYGGGRYNVLPADQALAGNVAPSTAPASAARGFEVRVVPLKYISAAEMKKILEPYARPNAIVNVDEGRNVISVGGTRAELENYLRTVDIFDVDWLSGMSVGVFPLQSGRADRVVGDLEKIFGADSGTPSAGMFRFLPLDNANAVMVITPQVRYLEQIQQWLERIDNAGGTPRLFSHELKYIKARELADRLAEVFGAPVGSGRNSSTDDPTLAPGAVAGTLGGSLGNESRRDVGANADGALGSSTASVQGSGMGEGGSLSLPPRHAGNGALTLEVEGERVGVSAVEETNTLLVRTTPQAWRTIRDVIDKLDVMPLQVHIEAQVAEVALEGALSYGVNWFFENSVSDAPSLGGAGLPPARGRNSWEDIRGSITGGGLGWTFLGRNGAAVISALDEVTDVRLLQTPSILVRNNAVATLNVGSKIPVYSVSVSGISDNQFSQVQYLNTGTILNVRPRVTRDGMVFMDIVQEVSAPEGEPDANGNVRVNTRRMRTEAAVAAGETVMLAGLIEDRTTQGSSGVPGLSRLPVVGGLFGSKRQSNRRSEVIVLLTPTIVRNPQESRALTDEYSNRFRALEPLRLPGAR